jgi:hypothetical protein
MFCTLHEPAAKSAGGYKANQNAARKYRCRTRALQPDTRAAAPYVTSVLVDFDEMARQRREGDDSWPCPWATVSDDSVMTERPSSVMLQHAYVVSTSVSMNTCLYKVVCHVSCKCSDVQVVTSLQLRCDSVRQFFGSNSQHINHHFGAHNTSNRLKLLKQMVFTQTQHHMPWSACYCCSLYPVHGIDLLTVLGTAGAASTLLSASAGMLQTYTDHINSRSVAAYPCHTAAAGPEARW